MRAIKHLSWVALATLAACSDAPVEKDKGKGKAPATKTAGGPVAGPAPSAAPAPVPAKPLAPATPAAKESVLVEARKRVLTKDDFTESDTNRDPFRSFLSSFAVTQVTNQQHPIVLEKFSIDELHLAGIVTGELTPRAMFIDPSGQGVAVVRGDHMSKADALVTRIAPDRVYLRVEELAVGQDKPRITERQIELHAGELSAQ